MLRTFHMIYRQDNAGGRPYVGGIKMYKPFKFGILIRKAAEQNFNAVSYMNLFGVGDKVVLG